MATQLRLLLAEDSQDDAILLVRDLQHAGYDVLSERVESRVGLETALAREPWDLVISDYSMPGFNGREVLDIVRATDPDVPFIFVSGTVGEDVAVAAMRAGAQDYVMKGKLRRLAPAVARELAAAHQRRDQRRKDEEHRATHEMLRTIFDSSPLAIVVTDTDGLVRAWNPAAVALLGWTPGEVLGMENPSVPDEHRAQATEWRKRALTGETFSGMEAPRRRKDGKLLDVTISVAATHDSDGKPEGLLHVYQDVTERKQLENEVHQAQKMEVVGQLAAGVAHDFNNLLTVIASYSEFLLADLAVSDPRRDDVQQIRAAAESATGLTRQLLVFTRQRVLAPKAISVNTVVENTGKLLARVLGAQVELSLNLDPRAGAITMDAGQFEQVIMNLAINARDAMPDGGTLTIETHGSTRRATPTGPKPFAHPAWYALVVVRDTGVGMDDATKERIFEPFFTTKAPGKGTGLGLATVYGIVRQYDGVVRVESEPGRGTAFRIYLPQTALPEETTEPKDAASTRGSETVLIAEDEPAVRAVTRQVLERLGYKVLEASDGQTALQLAAKHPAPIDVLLTDMNMPGMSGSRLAEQFALLRPKSAVLFFTGKHDALPMHATPVTMNARADHLTKPFTSADLARKVRSMLDAAATGR